MFNKRCVCVCVCRKHYREYLVSLINAHSVDPAGIYDAQELVRACERYQVDTQRGENEDDNAYHARLLAVRNLDLPATHRVLVRVSSLLAIRGCERVYDFFHV